MIKTKELKERIAVLYINIKCCLEDYKECNLEGDTEGAEKELAISKRYVEEWKNMYEFVKEYVEAPEVFELLHEMKLAIDSDNIDYLPDYSAILRDEIYKAKHY